MGKPVESVEFNDGEDEDVFAIVTKHNGGDNLNLFVIPSQGAAYQQNSVPRREKADYDKDGGGDTWHAA